MKNVILRMLACTAIIMAAVVSFAAEDEFPYKLQNDEGNNNAASSLNITAEIRESNDISALPVSERVFAEGGMFFLWIKVEPTANPTATVFIQVWQVSGNGDVKRAFPAYGQQKPSGAPRRCLEVKTNEWYPIPMDVTKGNYGMETYFVFASRSEFQDPRETIDKDPATWNKWAAKLVKEKLSVGDVSKPIDNTNTAFQNLLTALAKGATRGLVAAKTDTASMRADKLKDTQGLEKEVWQVNVIKVRTKPAEETKENE